VLAAYVSLGGSSVAMTYLQPPHHSIYLVSFDHRRQQQQQCLSGFSRAVLSKTTDSGGMPIVSGNQRRALHGHGGQVRSL